MIKSVKKIKSFGINFEKLLVVTYTGPRHPRWCENVKNISHYINWCLEFADNLIGTPPYKYMSIRLLGVGIPGNPHNYGWDEEERWKELHPNLEIDNGQKPINQFVKKSKLTVQTHFDQQDFQKMYIQINHVSCFIWRISEFIQLKLYHILRN